MEDQTLLPLCEKWRASDPLDRDSDSVEPYHVVGPKHDPPFETGVDQPTQIGVELLVGIGSVENSHIDIELRMGEHHRDHRVSERPAGVGNIDPQLGMTDEHGF